MTAPSLAATRPPIPGWTPDELAASLVAAGNTDLAQALLAPVQAGLVAALAAEGFALGVLAAPRVGAQAQSDSVSLAAFLAQDLADPLGQRPGLTLQARAFLSCGALLQTTISPTTSRARRTVRLQAVLVMSVVYVLPDGELHATGHPDEGPWGRELARANTDLSDPARADVRTWLEGALACDPGRLQDKVAQLVADLQQSLAP